MIDLQHDQYPRAFINHRFGSLFTSPPWIAAVSQAIDLQILAAGVGRKQRRAIGNPGIGRSARGAAEQTIVLGLDDPVAVARGAL